MSRKPRRRAVSPLAAPEPTASRPPYKCARTPNEQDCLKFYWNETEQRYNLPRGGERVRCADCEYYFDS
jgi:hypothetical protein